MVGVPHEPYSLKLRAALEDDGGGVADGVFDRRLVVRGDQEPVRLLAHGFVLLHADHDGGLPVCARGVCPGCMRGVGLQQPKAKPLADLRHERLGLIAENLAEVARSADGVRAAALELLNRVADRLHPVVYFRGVIVLFDHRADDLLHDGRVHAGL